MPLRVDSVIFCTSSACTVAARALPFCSSQNCTALSSSMRFSISSTLTVGATQCENGGSPAGGVPALPMFFRKSKPGMNLPKPKADASLIATPVQSTLTKKPGTSSITGLLVNKLNAQVLLRHHARANLWL